MTGLSVDDTCEEEERWIYLDGMGLKRVFTGLCRGRVVVRGSVE